MRAPTFSRLFSKKIRRIVECAAYDLRNVSPEVQARSKKMRSSFYHESPQPLGAMNSFTEILSEENFYAMVQMKVPDMLSARHLHSTHGKSNILWENMVSMGNVREEMRGALGFEREHPFMETFMRPTFFEPSFADEHIEIHYDFGSEKPFIVVPWPDNFTRHTHSLLTRIPLVAQPPLEPVQILNVYNAYKRDSPHMARLPSSPTEGVLNYFMYGELFGMRPQELEDLGWTRRPLPPIFYPLHNSSSQEHPNFVERFRNPGTEPLSSMPVLVESVRQVFHNIHIESVRPHSVSQLLDSCNCNSFFVDSVVAGTDGHYGHFLHRMNDVLLTTSARGMILYVVLDGLIGIVTRYSGKGAAQAHAFNWHAELRQERRRPPHDHGCFCEERPLYGKWLQSAASTEWGNVRMQDEADENFRKDTGGKIARGEAGEFRTTMLQYLENSEMGRSRFSRGEDDRLCEDTAMQGGFPPCNFFIMCSNLSEGDFDDAVISRMHVVRVYKGVSRSGTSPTHPSAGASTPKPAAKGLRFVLGAAAWLNILMEAGHFKEPDNPFLACFQTLCASFTGAGRFFCGASRPSSASRSACSSRLSRGTLRWRRWFARSRAVARARGLYSSFADQFVQHGRPPVPRQPLLDGQRSGARVRAFGQRGPLFSAARRATLPVCCATGCSART